MHDSIRHDRNGNDDAQQLARIAAALERLERRFDEFARVFLEARFPFGQPTDRWARRRGRGAA